MCVRLWIKKSSFVCSSDSSADKKLRRRTLLSRCFCGMPLRRYTLSTNFGAYIRSYIYTSIQRYLHQASTITLTLAPTRKRGKFSSLHIVAVFASVSLAPNLQSTPRTQFASHIAKTNWYNFERWTSVLVPFMKSSVSTCKETKQRTV